MIIHLASEVAPFYKRGGLGDVVGTLPKYLSDRQPNTVISFYYKNRMKVEDIELKGEFNIEIQNVTYEFQYYHYIKEGVDYYFLNMSDSFLFSDMEPAENDSSTSDGEKPYGENFPFIVYLYFAKASIKLIEKLQLYPEFIMLHDWHVCGCFAFPGLIKSLNPYQKCSTIVLIHNYEFQGEILPDHLHFLDSDVLSELLPIYEQYGTATFFALGFKNSDYVATVSETYAEELIQGRCPHIGLKFLDLIKKKKIYALPNGIDSGIWSPTCSPFIKNKYDVFSYKAIKQKAKQELHTEMNFNNDSEPVVLLMARLTEQKGINILIDLWSPEEVVMQQVKDFLDKGVKLVVYGSPSRGLTGNIHKRLTLAKKMFPGRFNYISNYTEERAHTLLAASDMILCPSLFEPCGLVQMFALAFGTIPIVRPVGGLRDTIIPHHLGSQQSTGFYIDDFNHESLKETIEKAVYVYQHEKIEWDGIIERGMKKDYSWENIIEQYNVFLDEVQEEVASYETYEK